MALVGVALAIVAVGDRVPHEVVRAAVIAVLDLVGVEHVDVRALDVADASTLGLGERVDADVSDLLGPGDGRYGKKGEREQRKDASGHAPRCGATPGKVTRIGVRVRAPRGISLIMN